MGCAASVGYIPYSPTDTSIEAGWLEQGLGCAVDIVRSNHGLNLLDHERLPEPAALWSAFKPFLTYPWIVAEGIGGFLWAAVARSNGFGGAFTLLPYLNPTSWFDLTSIAAYRRWADPRDRIFVGSTASARVYQAFGVDAIVGEPFGVDCDVFRPRPEASVTITQLGIAATAPIMLFAGRVEPDKDLHRLLSVALKAHLLIPNLQVVIASHVVDRGYLSLVTRLLAREHALHLIAQPSREQLAALYTAADVFVTASTSHFETFGRAPAEALACGTTAIAPRYDGFADVLAQPGGKLVAVDLEDGVPRASEGGLLRAVYEALTFPPDASASEIAATARRRFSRARSLGLLDYLAGSAASAPIHPARLDALEVRTPDPWRAAACRMAAMNSREALAHIWNRREHGKLAGLDESFRITIRNVLAAAALELPGTSDAGIPCR